MIVTIDGIPVFDALISDEACGMFKISLVDDPAVQSNFLAFDSHKKQLMYAIENEDKRIVRGVVMRANYPIFRQSEDLGEFYVMYKPETIRQMAEKYLVEKRQNDVNIMHMDESDVDGVQMVQYFIKDSANGVNPKGFEDISDGSLFAEFHVVNDRVLEAIKAGTFRGFSLEGVFELTPERNTDLVDEIVDELDGKFNSIKKSNNMTKKERIMAALEKLLVKCGSTTTDKGILAWDGDGELEAGMDVFTEDAEGNRNPAEDGDYKTEDGKTIRVAEGKVAEILDPEAEVEPEEAPAPSLAEEIAGAEIVDETGTDDEGNPLPEAEPVAEEALDEVAELKKEVADLWDAVNKLTEALAGNQADVAEVSETLSKIAHKSMAKPAHAEVKEAGKQSATGNKGLDRLARVLSAK